jgi:predicted nucleotidyltransferase
VPVEVTQQYINELVAAYPSIREVWLLGSRANNRAEERSDWDYLVFADDDRVLNDLSQSIEFKRPGIDLLFAGTIDIAASPWPESDGDHKMLGLGMAENGICWRVISDDEAEYFETKDANPDKPHDMAILRRVAKARLVWRRPSGI